MVVLIIVCYAVHFVVKNFFLMKIDPHFVEFIVKNKSVFCASDDGVPLGIGYWRKEGVKTSMMGSAIRWSKKF